jgi:hypothetical protein
MLQLRKMPAIAPQGQNNGVFSNISVVEGQDTAGKACQTLKVEVQLDAKNSDGVPYTVAKQYNLNKRGVTLFEKDFAAWSNRELTDEELDQFDAENLMKNKPVQVEVKHRKEGKKMISVIGSFLPTSDTASAAA